MRAVHMWAPGSRENPGVHICGQGAVATSMLRGVGHHAGRPGVLASPGLSTCELPAATPRHYSGGDGVGPEDPLQHIQRGFGVLVRGRFGRAEPPGAGDDGGAPVGDLQHPPIRQSFFAVPLHLSFDDL